jgi:hypothetical protein
MCQASDIKGQSEIELRCTDEVHVETIIRANAEGVFFGWRRYFEAGRRRAGGDAVNACQTMAS